MPTQIQLRRIGKSLLKFFGPVYVTHPHAEARLPVSHETTVFAEAVTSASDEAAVFELRRGEAAPETARAPAADEPAEAAPNPNHWLDLVVHLLSTCKRVSKSVARKSGVEAYRKNSQHRGQSRAASVVGSIVDTLPQEEKEKRAA